MSFLFLIIVAIALPMCLYYSKNPLADQDRAMHPLPLVVVSVGVSSFALLANAIQSLTKTGEVSMPLVQGLVLLGLAIWGLTITLKKEPAV